MPSDYPNHRSGRCLKCNVRYVWRGKPRLRDAFCWCGRQLRATTLLFRGETVEQKPANAQLRRSAKEIVRGAIRST